MTRENIFSATIESFLRLAFPATRNSTRKQHPDRIDALLFRAKASFFQLKRAIANSLTNEIREFSVNDLLKDKPVLAESSSELWKGNNPAEEFLIAGKIQNLRVAIRRLNGIEIPAGKTFSFWAQTGLPTKFKGYVQGRELREGCIIPNIGGGLCQLSNALYDAAIRAGFEIVERHAHTQVIPGSLAESGRDATVFWNYVDLRFRSKEAFRIEATITADSLIVKFRGNPRTAPLQRRPTTILPFLGKGPHSCATCGVESCHRSIEANPQRVFGRTAYLVDEYHPEFETYLSSVKTDRDVLCLPIDGRRFGRQNYAWTTSGFAKIFESRMLTLLRAYQSRKLAQQGAARQRNQILFQTRLATSYANHLTYDVTHIVVTQQLLPYLWRDGVLGGRTFDVLMTGLPLEQIHQRLDQAYALHPESKTLADFRADDDLVLAESKALKSARRIITPHSEIAELFRDKTVLLDWKRPDQVIERKGRFSARSKIGFPGPTVGRKGAYELRQAIEDLDVELLTSGPDLEGRGFWDGFNTRKLTKTELLDQSDIIVLPAFIEHNPRVLLNAIARGIPVIASTACGLGEIDGVITVACGDDVLLRGAIRAAIERGYK